MAGQARAGGCCPSPYSSLQGLERGALGHFSLEPVMMLSEA